jgi:hypothetical protein
MQVVKRKHFKQFLGAMAVFVILLTLVIFGVALLSNQPDTRRSVVDTSWRYLIFLLPVIPAVLALKAFTGAVSELDELERRIQLEAFAFSLGGTCLLTFGYGFLEYAGMPHINWFFIFPVIVFLWVWGVVLARKRYR